jgi:biopolymer transport protein ExbD
MQGAFNARRPRRRPFINITSLIDVMFLLLIFFMVSSTFRHQHGIDVALPAAATSEQQDLEATELVVLADGTYRFGDETLRPRVLADALRRHVAEQPDRRVVLRADEGADWGAVVAAIDAAREAGGSELIIQTSLESGAAP